MVLKGRRPGKGRLWERACRAWSREKTPAGTRAPDTHWGLEANRGQPPHLGARRNQSWVFPTRGTALGVQKAAGTTAGQGGPWWDPGSWVPPHHSSRLSGTGPRWLHRLEKSWSDLSNLLTQYMIHVFPLTPCDSCVSPSSHPCFPARRPAPPAPVPPPRLRGLQRPGGQERARTRALEPWL